MPEMTDIMPYFIGLSGASDIFSAYQQHREAQRRQQLYSILSDPAKLASYIQGIHQPMSTAEQQEIARNTQAEMGMRGTGDGQYANLAAARAYAGIEGQQRGQETQAALSALGGMYPYQGTPGAPGGSTGEALKYWMLLRSLNQGNKPQSPGMTPTEGSFPGLTYNQGYQQDPWSYDIGSQGGSYGGYSGLPALTTNYP